MLEDVEGALWKGWMPEVEGFRPRREHLPDMQCLVVVGLSHRIRRSRARPGRVA
ncbi:hypothetical protein [Streptomyces sp. NPDC088789]|uniref:hypothetical protein n=1 Tax=Streptomyces sp. NPDC088789 TaxID=3365899 RepID=UPI0038118283